MTDTLLTIRNLKTYFFLNEGTVRAVDGVDLDVFRGKTLALVGESGCGKSVLAYSILRLVVPPGKIVNGRIVLRQNEKNIPLTELKANSQAIRQIRGKDIAMIFQEPMTSLSPVHTVGSQITEAVRLHTDWSKTDARDRAIQMMTRVGISEAARRFDQYPDEMSGGLRQRAVIAMALSCRPSLLIADEPTTALDVTIQAQILELMRDLQREFGMSILLITHDLGVVAEIAEHVAVMYMGRIVEQADAKSIFYEPRHPYTRALLKSMPGFRHGEKRLAVISGSVPDPFTQISGCPFHPRCEEVVRGFCARGSPPPLREIKPAHKVACQIRHQELAHDGEK